MDTIFAPATAWGKAGVAIIRISGPLAFSAASTLAGSLPPPRHAALRRLRESGGGVLDDALVLTFEEGGSFTGEDTVEFQVHGSLSVLNAIQAALGSLPGLRQARPGEFTRRALENNRLDLTQVEGLADLIEAETEVQRLQAQRVLSGSIGAMADRWRKDLIRAAALLEATIDFADEDVPTDVSPEVISLIDGVMVDLKSEILASQVAARIRDGFEIAIVGSPNVGKSTLLNYLAGREAAITSEVAGTTRDVIEVRMDLGGLPVTFLDTAGLRDTDDSVEAIGVRRARERALAADVRIVLLEKDDERPKIEVHQGDFIVVSKGDLYLGESRSVSGLTGAGVDDLVSDVVNILKSRVMISSGASRERHRSAIEDGLVSLKRARSEVLSGAERTEFAAESVRSVIRALDALVGRVGVEHVLDEIFASFCLGK